MMTSKLLKGILAIAIVVLSSTAFAQKTPQGVTYDVTLLRVTDGDTVVFKASFLPAPLKQELALRVFGVDTPEKGFRAKCESEAQRGAAASAFTKQAVMNSKTHQVVLMDWDKFGGRVLGDLLLDGKSLRQMLIANNYAREYYGEAKQSWCN
jgi:endonuclease YncB( thermonuclease family)